MTTQAKPQEGDVRGNARTGYEVFVDGAWAGLDELAPPEEYVAINIDPRGPEVIFQDAAGDWVDSSGNPVASGGIEQGGGEVDPAWAEIGVTRPDWWPEDLPAPVRRNDLDEPEFDQSAYFRVHDRFAPKKESAAGPGQVVRGEDVGGQPGTFFIKQPSGNLTPYTPPQEEPFFETEARQAQQAAPQAARSMDALMAQELDRGNDARAMQIRRIEDAPSDFEVLKLAIQYADNPAALKVIYDFTKAQGLAAAQDPMFRQQQAAEPPTITWNAATGQWERIGQTAIGKLDEIDPQAQAQALRQFDPTMFTGTPPGEDFPGMGTPEEAFGTAVGEEGGFTPLPVLPGQERKTRQPAPGDVTFGTGENAISIEEAKRLGERDTLLRSIEEGGIGATVPTEEERRRRSFSPAAQKLLSDPTRQAQAGQTQLFNPQTNEVRIIGSDDSEFALTQPQFKGFQVTGSTPAPQFNPTKQTKPEDTFEDFQRQFEPFKTKRQTRRPFGRPFAVR